MGIREIKTEELNTERFIAEKIEEISKTVGAGAAITALSGGVDSSVVTVLGHKALGSRLKAYFLVSEFLIPKQQRRGREDWVSSRGGKTGSGATARNRRCLENIEREPVRASAYVLNNGLMRQNEPQEVVSRFKKLGIPVEIIDARKEFFDALKGITDPEEKREAITQTFYKKVFGKLVKESGAKHLLQGTILTDVEETVAGVKRQHNILSQLGIDPQKAFGYKIIEPLVQLRKDGVRKVAKALGLPESIYSRMPFPGPALAARVIGEVSSERIALIRKATAITEEELANAKAFQYMAILHQDRVTGIRNGKRDFGLQIEIRCWESVDARTATPSRLPYEVLARLAKRITTEVPGVVSVSYNITSKPPSTMEAI